MEPVPWEWDRRLTLPHRGPRKLIPWPRAKLSTPRGAGLEWMKQPSRPLAPLPQSPQIPLSFGKGKTPAFTGGPDVPAWLSGGIQAFRACLGRRAEKGPLPRGQYKRTHTNGPRYPRRASPPHSRAPRPGQQGRCCLWQRLTRICVHFPSLPCYSKPCSTLPENSWGLRREGCL